MQKRRHHLSHPQQLGDPAKAAPSTHGACDIDAGLVDTVCAIKYIVDQPQERGAELPYFDDAPYAVSPDTSFVAETMADCARRSPGGSAFTAQIREA